MNVEIATSALNDVDSDDVDVPGTLDLGKAGDDGSGAVSTQTLGVGGITAPAAGPGVVLATADRATKLTITTPNTIYDGGGFQVTGGIDVMADGVTVQNFRINARRQYGVYAEGRDIIIQNNDIANVKASGDGDLNAITGFGENLRVLFNTAMNFVTGDPGASHTDFFQTWISSSHPTGSTGLEVRGNKATGPANPERRKSIASIHQCVMIEGRGRGGNKGGTGDTKNIVISDNEFGDSWNQCIKLDGVQGAVITRNKFTGSSDHVVAITSASSDIKYYSDNVVSDNYGDVGVSIITGAGPGASSGGGSGTDVNAATSPAALLNIGKGAGKTRANIGIGFKAGEVPQPNPDGARAGTAEHVDYDLTYLENGLEVPGYFELVTVDGEQRVRMTVTGMGGRTSKKTGYDRVEFRALADNGVDKQWYDPTVKDFQSILYVAGYLMKSPPNKPQVCVAQLHDPDDDIAMVRFRTKTTVEAKLGDTVLGNLTTSYSLGTRYQALIRTTGRGGGKYDCEWAWSQGATPLPTSGPGYFKQSGISASAKFYQKAGDYGQSRVHGYTNKTPASSQGDEDASNSPLFIVDMTKLVMFTTGMAEPITTMG
jgi:hypothetical protein